MERSTASELAVELMSPSAEKRTDAGPPGAPGVAVALGGADGATAGGAVGVEGGVTASGLLQPTAVSSAARTASTVTAVRRRVMTAV